MASVPWSPTSFPSLLFPLFFYGSAPSGRFTVGLVPTVLLRKEHVPWRTVSRDSGTRKHNARMAHPGATGANFLLLIRKWRYSQTKIIMFARHSRAAVSACTCGAVFTLLYTVVYLSHWSSSPCSFMFIFPNAQYLPVIQESHNSDLLNWVWAMISSFWV